MRRVSLLLLCLAITAGAVTITIGTPTQPYKMPFCAD